MTKDLKEIYRSLKELLKMYEGDLIAKIDTEDKYDLWSIKNLVIEGRKRNEIYFAGLMIQKSYVGLYYMPIYSDIELKEVFGEDLIKLLKGKSCFHIKKLDDKLLKQIKEAIEIGYKLYLDRGWI